MSFEILAFIVFLNVMATITRGTSGGAPPRGEVGGTPTAGGLQQGKSFDERIVQGSPR
jgi:hypothetical protein